MVQAAMLQKPVLRHAPKAVRGVTRLDSLLFCGQREGWYAALLCFFLVS